MDWQIISFSISWVHYMDRLSHSCLVVLSVSVLLVAARTADASEQGPEAPVRCAECGRRVTVPFARIAVMELAMHTAAGALWPEAYHPLAVSRNRDQFTRSWRHRPDFRFNEPFFGSDGDWWYFNVFAHALFGSEAYLAGRGWGHRPVVAGLFAAFASFTWEYLVEAWYKTPSAIDLFWTPLSGVLFGELRYRAYLAATRRVSRGRMRRFLQAVIDPLGSFERRALECALR